MACGRNALVAVAAIAAAVSMQGCGLPDAIKIPCQDSLQGPLQKTSMESMQKAEDNCRSTFKAHRQQSLCIFNSAGFVKQAQDRSMSDFVDKCGEFARKHVCTTKDCKDISPAQLHAVIQTWVNNQFNSLVQQMIASVNRHLHDVIQEDYMTKFWNRPIPSVVRQQCHQFIVSRLTGGEAIPAQSRIQQICAQRTPEGSPAWMRCQSAGAVRLSNVRQQQINSLAQRCSRNTLDQACPIGSQCAIETSEVPLWETDNLAQAYLNLNFQAFLFSLQNAYMQVANSFSWGGGGTFKKLFELPDHLFTQSTFTMGVGFFAAIVMVTMGGVAFVLRMRRRQEREVMNRPESSELLSVEEQRKEQVVE